MKKLLLLSIVFIWLSVCHIFMANGQGAAINASGTSPDPSAILDASSNTKGVLISRMTTIERNAIILPATGLFIYNTDCGELQYYNGTNWVSVINSLSLAAPVAAAGSGATSAQITANWNSVTGATGYFLDVAADAAFTSFVSGYNNFNVGNSLTLTIPGLNCGTTYYYRVRANKNCGTSGSSNTISYSTSACWTCGNTITVVHNTSDGFSPINTTITYSTISSNVTGVTKCWLYQNLGASTQASSANDASAAPRGWFWQFNRKQGYKNEGTVTPAWTITSMTENSDWTTINNPCQLLGSDWRLPTYDEWVFADGPWNSWNGPYGALKMHAAGLLNTSNGSLSNIGGSANYWSITQGNNTNSYNLSFDSGSSKMGNDSKAFGFSIRCLKD